jgi:HAE1 family hydrophobic/amphiphilic exporter-1
MGGGEARFQVEIHGADVDTLYDSAPRAKQQFASVPGLVDLDISLRPGKPEVEFHVDRPKAADVGVTVGQVASTLRTAVDGTVAGQYREAGKDYDLRVQLREQDRRTVGQLDTLRVGSTGALVPLREVADVREATGPVTIYRVDKQRTATVTADIAEGFALSDVQRLAEEKLKAMGLPAGYTYKVAGEAEIFGESKQSIKVALILAVLFVFMILAAQFESLLHPFTIGLSLPFAVIGAILALLLTGNTMNIMAMIGIVMLMGLVTKNAILLVDYTNTLRHRGMERNAAVLQAGPTRLRPILMTTAAMVFGMLPVALGLGAGAGLRAPMAICVIGGLLSSLLLTLVVVPVVYTFMDDLSKRLSRRHEESS